VAFVEAMFDAFSQSNISNVVVRDMCLGAVNCTPRTFVLSMSELGTPSERPQLFSDDQRRWRIRCVRVRPPTNLVSGDTNGVSDIFPERF